MLLTGEQIDADEAHRIGLTQVRAEAGAGVDVAHDLAVRIAAMAPIAAQSTKNLIRIATSTSVEVGMRYENDMFAYCMMTDDAAEGRRGLRREAPARVQRGVSGGDRRGHPPHRHPARGPLPTPSTC